MREESQTYQRKHASLSISSILLGAVGLLMFPVSIFIYRPGFTYYLGFRYAWMPASIGLFIGIIAVWQSKTHEQANGVKAARRGIILCLIVSLLSILIPPRMSFAVRMYCGTHVGFLGKAIRVYAQDSNGEYPDPTEWCDRLMVVADVSPDAFLCIPDYQLCYFGLRYSNLKPGIGKSHYAMNINCRPDSSPDTVLLFETSLGWNEHGGPELLALENHNGDGCNILFNGGHVQFVKRPLELNWGEASNKGLNPDGLAPAD